MIKTLPVYNVVCRHRLLLYTILKGYPLHLLLRLLNFLNRKLCSSMTQRQKPVVLKLRYENQLLIVALSCLTDEEPLE